MSFRVLFVLPLFLLACAGSRAIQPIAYTAQPDRISDPAAETKAIILANTVQGCVSEPEFIQKMLVVKFVCHNGVGNYTAKFDRVQSIVLEQSGEWYRVVLKHNDKSEDFAWSAKSLEDIRRMADALTALSNAASSPTSAPAANTTTL